MDNEQLHDDKLFRAIQQRLSDYETSYEGADWDAMNRSLNQLPQTKTTRFQLRFSMNTFLIGVGVVLVVALGYYWVSRPSSASQEITIPVQLPAVNDKQKESTKSVSRPLSPPNTPSIEQAATGAVTPPTSSASQQVVTTKQPPPSQIQTQTDVRFGDQIDPVKGFVLPTHESDSLKGLHIDRPDHYYDMENGRVKSIQLDEKVDSAISAPADSIPRD